MLHAHQKDLSLKRRALNERHDHPDWQPGDLAWGNYIAAWRDSEFATCMPTDWYSVYRTSPIWPKSTTQQLSRFFTFLSADPSRIFRGHMLKPFYINANTRTFISMLIYIYIYIFKIMVCIFMYISICRCRLVMELVFI